MSKDMTPLEALEQLKYYNTLANDDFDMTKELDIIETALIKLEKAENCVFTSKEDVKKKLKALEIIKNKFVEIRWVVGDKPFIDSRYGLTNEEYNLLKEVL